MLHGIEDDADPTVPKVSLRRSSLARRLALSTAVVLGGAALVVALIVGAVNLTGPGHQDLAPIGISYDFEPAAGTHGGTAASVVKADIEGFGVGSTAAVSTVVDQPTLACYLVKSDESGAVVSLVEIDGSGAGSLAGVSRWAGQEWQAFSGRSRARQCESLAPRPTG
jgi:hypothetical protein